MKTSVAQKQVIKTEQMKSIVIGLLLLTTGFLSYSQKVGINNSNPVYDLDVNGYSASSNQVAVIPLWQNGVVYNMFNTVGADLNNCESALDPTLFSADGNIEVKLVVRIQNSSAGVNNFQLRTHNGTTESFPIVNTDSWTYASTQTGLVAISPWKQWDAGTNVHEIHLYGWVDAGNTDIISAYLMVRPRRS